MSEYILEFESPLKQIENKIDSLKKTAQTTGIDINSSLSELNKQLLSKKKEIYKNLSRWQRLELARHPGRPYSLDYIKLKIY